MISRKILILATLSVLSAAALSVHGQKCGLKIGALIANPSDTAASVAVPGVNPPITNYSAYAIRNSTGKKYPSVVEVDDHIRDFGEIPAGKYRVFVSKPGYKTTVQAVDLSCAQSFSRTAFVRLWKGSSAQRVNVTTDAKLLREMRLDRVTKLGPTDSDTGYRVVQPGESYKSGAACKGPLPNTVSGGVLNGKATSLPKPVYPPAARAVKATGAVSIQVLIDENGNVVSANAVSGHPLLRAAAEAAAREAKFIPTLLAGQPVKVSGIIVYNFVP